MGNTAHGAVGKLEHQFTHLLPLRAFPYDAKELFQLSKQMKGEVDNVKDGPDPEENLSVPAGYTYLGQFVDHDLTFDSTSTLSPEDGSMPTNMRSPRFDLDCLYGDGPASQPYLYDTDGATLLYKRAAQSDDVDDLVRNSNGRAIIGDKRNDENAIVCQLQLAFIKYHNAVVEHLKATVDLKGADLFTAARNEVRWAYQLILVEDFLPRIIRKEVLAGLHGPTMGRPQKARERAPHYALFSEEKRGNLPREFVGAAYRFGHSGVRTGYRMNEQTRANIFPNSDPEQAGDPRNQISLLGFRPLAASHKIDDWRRFFPDPSNPLPIEERDAAANDAERGAVRLQFAYKIDATLVDPLAALPRAEVAGEATTQQAIAQITPDALPNDPRPSLALLNLLRGNSYFISGGQRFASALKAKGASFEPIDRRHLVTRKSLGDGKFQFVPIPESLQIDTPLWFYILAEAQEPIAEALGRDSFDETVLLQGIGAHTQLGWVGGRIVSEVFYGLLDADDESFVNMAPAGWQPKLGGDGTPTLANLLKFTGLM